MSAVFWARVVVFEKPGRVAALTINIMNSHILCKHNANP